MSENEAETSDRQQATGNRQQALPEGLRPENVRAVRLGHGANCSSVGSVIDTLFIGAAVGGALFAAVCAAMKSEGVRVVGAGAGDVDEADDGREEEKK